MRTQNAIFVQYQAAYNNRFNSIEINFENFFWEENLPFTKGKMSN